MACLIAFGMLLFFETFRHIDLEQINGIPDFTGRKHGIDGSQDHPGNSNDSAFFAPTLGNTLIFQGIVRILFVLHCSMGDLHQRRFKINTSA